MSVQPLQIKETARNLRYDYHVPVSVADKSATIVKCLESGELKWDFKVMLGGNSSTKANYFSVFIGPQTEIGFASCSFTLLSTNGEPRVTTKKFEDKQFSPAEPDWGFKDFESRTLLSDPKYAEDKIVIFQVKLTLPATSSKLSTLGFPNIAPPASNVLFESREYADVELVVGKNTIKAHKALLAASSKYFASLFFNGMAESTQKRIHLESDVNYEALQIVLEYLYNGRWEDLEKYKQTSVLINVVQLAYKFEVDGLKDASIALALHGITLENAVEMMILIDANTYGLPSKLREGVASFIKKNIKVMKFRPEFRQLKKDVMWELMC